MKSRSSLLHLKPYKVYKKFIEKCSAKKYDKKLTLHKHHIIPKFIDTNLEHEQLVELSVEDHIQAHLLLAKCFDEGSVERVGNLRSAQLLNRKSLKIRDELLEAYKHCRGDNNPAKRPEVRRKISNSLKGRKSEKKGKTYVELYGEEKAILEKKKRSKKTRTDEEYHISSKKAIQTRILNGNAGIGVNNGNAKSIIIDGNLYGTRKEACESLNISYPTLKKRYL